MVRKRQGDRIERENLAFAKRLLEKHSEFDKRVLDEEFEKNLKYKSNVQKVNFRKYVHIRDNIE